MRHRRTALLTAFIATFALMAAACSGSGGTASRPSTTTTTYQPVAFEPELSPTVSGIGDPFAPDLGNSGYDVSRYEITMDYNSKTERVSSATAVITATANEDLDMYHLDFEGFRLDGVEVDGVEAGYTQEGSELVVKPAVPVIAGAEFVTEVDYGGTPRSFPSQLARYDVGWMVASKGTRYIRAEPDGVRAWFPANNHPLDKAEFQVEVTVDKPFVAAASGTLARSTRGVGEMTYRWTTPPVAPHTMTLIIGKQRLVEDEVASDRSGIQIRHLLPKKIADDPPAVLNRLDLMIQFMEQRFGPYPYESYGIAVVDGETPFLPSHSWTIMTEAELLDDQAEVRIASDLARHWFGDSVSPETWSEVWLSTSIPTYAGWLWVESQRGREVADLVARTARRNVADSSWPPPDDPPPGNIYVDSVFIHGASYLHALRLKVGDGSFFDVLSTLHADNAGGVANTKDFVDLTNRLTRTSYSYFFDAWMHGDDLPGYPSR